MSGTVPPTGSSMPASNPVKVIKATPKNIQPPTNSSPNPTPVQGTPESAGAPTSAPSQTIILTGKGAVQKGLDGHADQGGLTPPPAAHLQTGPTIPSPSVNYNAGQETPTNILHLPPAVIPLGEQDQRT